MEGIHLIKHLLQKDWLVKIDLKDAYFAVPIHQAHRFPRFQFKGVINCLPFGLSSASRIYTKMIRPVTAWLRQLGCQATSTTTWYSKVKARSLDDWTNGGSPLGGSGVHSELQNVSTRTNIDIPIPGCEYRLQDNEHLHTLHGSKLRDEITSIEIADRDNGLGQGPSEIHMHSLIREGSHHPRSTILSCLASSEELDCSVSRQAHHPPLRPKGGASVVGGPSSDVEQLVDSIERVSEDSNQYLQDWLGCNRPEGENRWTLVSGRDTLSHQLSGIAGALQTFVKNEETNCVCPSVDRQHICHDTHQQKRRHMLPLTYSSSKENLWMVLRESICQGNWMSLQTRSPEWWKITGTGSSIPQSSIRSTNLWVLFTYCTCLPHECPPNPTALLLQLETRPSSSRDRCLPSTVDGTSIYQLPMVFNPMHPIRSEKPEGQHCPDRTSQAWYPML